ncbi:MAG: PQQ-dependent dehydrogenase, methanol/ethanol family [Acidobacteria bacterium]|nr:PQQ-dependent dehydrogenase, methanol/ethanol family [Acidobacteriota bacterium]
MGSILLCALLFAGAIYGQAGKSAYLSRCVGCHGEDGSGGGHGPGILNVRASRVVSRQALLDVIRNGIPAAGMPAFALPANEVEAIADYVTVLRSAGSTNVEVAKGDAAVGERVFNGGCVQCHMVRGRGGVLGPDLTVVGKDRSAAEILAALRGSFKRPVRTVSVKLLDGSTLRGIAKNENPFDLQLLATDGSLRLLRKTEVTEVADGPSLMPRFQGSQEELLGVVAYLSSLKTEPTVAATTGWKGVWAPKPGEWPSYNGSYTGNRYSALDQINAGNVGRLAPAWMFPIPGAPGSLQTTPVVVDGVMYVTSVNEAFALDARSGREIWHYKRPRTKGLAGDAASGINRGVAVLGDRVFLATDNAHLIALHRLTGQLIWDVEMADYRENYGATGAPLVVNDLVIAGISGGDEGVRGFLDAYKASTGERVWRFWTIPARGEPGSETWSGKAIEHGCGTTWLTGTYDPELKLLYWPTGNPCPDYNGDERKGDNLYTDSVVALDPATGKLRWHYQFTPHDLHDWDATETPVLVDFGGKKLLAQANRNGFFYVLDRVTGKVLTAEPFVKNLTWAKGIGADGRPILLPGNEPTAEGQRTCPSVAGAANWTSTAFSPRTELFYFFAQESCNVYSKRQEEWQAGKSFYGGGTRNSPGDNSGKYLRAMNIRNGKVAWEIPNIGGGILGSGLMATGGGLLFYGDGRGAFVAADSSSGKLLWHFNAAVNWKAGPMTYMAGGAQHVAVAAGSTIVSFTLR